MTATLKVKSAGSSSASVNAPAPASRFWAWFLAVPPFVAVVAGLTTVYIAVTHPDPVLPREPSTRAVNGAGLPAQVARNQAATEAAKYWSDNTKPSAKTLDGPAGVQK